MISRKLSLAVIAIVMLSGCAAEEPVTQGINTACCKVTGAMLAAPGPQFTFFRR